MDIPKGLRKFRATDREECGLIIEGKDRTYVVKVPNRSERDDSYVIIRSDISRVEAVLSDDERIVGYFHTHLPNHPCEPSNADLESAEKFPGINHLIYKPTTKETQWYGVVAEVAPAT
jgi:proteasome lid subunit RPN8/RPN11